MHPDVDDGGLLQSERTNEHNLTQTNYNWFMWDGRCRGRKSRHHVFPSSSDWLDALFFFVVIGGKVIKPSNLSISGNQATFNCTVVSGFRQGARVTIVEVTNKDNEVRYQGTSFTAVNLQVPGGGESHTRRFVCEMWLRQQLLSKSKVAQLVIVPPGKIKVTRSSFRKSSKKHKSNGIHYLFKFTRQNKKKNEKEKVLKYWLSFY